MADESHAATVRFELCGGYWERIIDVSAVAANKGDKAGISYGLKYAGMGWEPKGQTYQKDDQVFIVEGIFYAIALWLAGYKAIAAISCNNFPWDIIEANKGKNVRWVIALDDDKAGREVIPKYRGRLASMKEICQVALAGERDWDDIYRDNQLDDAFLVDALYQGQLFCASSAMKKAYLVYMRRPRPFFLVEFESCLYSARVNTSELQKDLDDVPRKPGEDTCRLPPSSAAP